MGFFSKFFNALQSVRINKENGISGTPLNHLLTSSMYAEQQSAYLNSYETGLNQSDIKNIIENAWHLFNKEDVLETLETLLYRNQDEHINVVYLAYNNSSNYVEILKTKLPNNEDIFNHYLEIYRALKKVVPELIANQVIENAAELNHIKDSGWNIGRAAFIARCSYDLGYLSKVELIDFLEKCYSELKKYCNTWKEYTTSYILGRAIWGGSNNNGMISIANSLLTNENSPLKNKTYI